MVKSSLALVRSFFSSALVPPEFDDLQASANLPIWKLVFRFLSVVPFTDIVAKFECNVVMNFDIGRWEHPPT